MKHIAFILHNFSTGNKKLNWFYRKLGKQILCLINFKKILMNFLNG